MKIVKKTKDQQETKQNSQAEEQSRNFTKVVFYWLLMLFSVTLFCFPKCKQ